MSPYQPFGFGGDERVRTDDPLLAKQVLSQLSYTPINGSKLFGVLSRLYRTSKIKQRLTPKSPFFRTYCALTLKSETVSCFLAP